MAIKFMDLFFALADGTFTVQAYVESSPTFDLFCFTKSANVQA